jgi:hypothetical protein
MTNSIVFFLLSYSSSQRESDDNEDENDEDENDESENNEDDEMISRENDCESQNNNDKYVDLRFSSRFVINFSTFTRCIRR